MKNKKIKLIVAIIFFSIVIAGGFFLSHKINRKAIKTTGHKTSFNPLFIDSMVQENKKKNK